MKKKRQRKRKTIKKQQQQQLTAISLYTQKLAIAWLFAYWAFTWIFEQTKQSTSCRYKVRDYIAQVIASILPDRLANGKQKIMYTFQSIC